MDQARSSFLAAVLGADSIGPLTLAVEQEPAFEPILVPRAVMAWVKTVGSFDGVLSSEYQSAISFSKSETGYSGRVISDYIDDSFSDVSVFRVVAAISTVLGVEPVDRPQVSGADLDRLGRTLDGLAERQLAKAEAEKLCEDCKKKVHEGECEVIEKDEATAPSAPTAPTAPTISAAPDKAPALPKPKMPKLKAESPTLTLQRSEVGAKCSACGGTQFKGDKFDGCLCFQALNKGVTVSTIGNEAIVLKFDATWDFDDVLTLREVFRG